MVQVETMKSITTSVIIGYLFLVMAPTGESFQFRPNFTCEGNPVDVVFVLDSSSSIWGEDFLSQLHFVNYLVDQLDIGNGPKQARVGVETFNDAGTVHIDLDEFFNKKELKKKIANIQQILGNTSIGDALSVMRARMFTQRNGARPNVKHVGVILTDGESQDKQKAQREAAEARYDNIELVVIGIGKFISRPELEGIASRPQSKYLFYTPTYAALDHIRDDVLKYTCSKQPDVVCTDRPMDLVFVLDTSLSILREDFQKQLNFVKNMVDYLDIGSGPNQVRIGVEAFSDYASVYINLNNIFEKHIIKWKIDQIPQMYGSTNIGESLRELRETMFTPQNGARPNVRHVAIILTGGSSQDHSYTQREARECRSTNIELWVIGIGNYISKSELRGIVSKPKSKHVFYAPSYTTLNSVSQNIIDKTCEAVTPRPPGPTNPQCNNVEVLFMIHHIHFGPKKTKLLLEASDEVISKVGRSNNFRFGVIFDKCPLNKDITGASMIRPHHSSHRQLSKIHFSSIVDLMNKLRIDAFSDMSYNVRRIGLLFLDNTIDLKSPELSDEISRINFNLIDLYVVAVGDIDTFHVEAALSLKYPVLRIASYDHLSKYLPSMFIETVCKK